MTYSISTKSGSASFSVTDGAINTDLDISLVGKGYVGYGTALNTNFVRLLENFADTTGNEPTKSIVGQLFYNISNNRLLVFDGADYIPVSPKETAFTDLYIGNIYYDATSITGQLTNTNINVIANGTGTVNINRLAIQNTATGRILFTAANGMVSTNSLQYNPTSDTLTTTSVSATNLAGTITTAAQAQITSLGTLTGLSVSGTSALTGNVTAGNVRTSGTGGQFIGYHTGAIGANVANTGAFTSITATTTAGITGNLSAGNVRTSGTGGQIIGYLTGAIGANVANTGAFTTVTATDSSGAVSATQILNVVNGVYSAGFVPRAGSGTSNGLTAVNDSLLVFSNGTMGTGNLTIAPWAGAESGIRIQSVANVSTVTLAGNVTTIGNITPSANITYNLGTTTASWANVYAVNFSGTSTTAKYADLAEKYISDAVYTPGTVVEFGGINEITIATSNTKRVAGIVSTNPAYLMNSDADGELALAVALQGRVPCKVYGPIEKGDMLVSAGNGYAEVNNDPLVGTVVGKSLEKFDKPEGVIEVVVGRC